MLASQYRRIVIYHYGYSVIIQRKGCYFYIFIVVFVENAMRHFKKVSKGVLFFQASLFYSIYKRLGTSIHNRRFGSIKLNKDIINLQAHQCSKGMLYCINAGAVFFNSSSSG